MTSRKFNPYEQTQIARYGKSKKFKGDASSAPVEYITGKVEFCGLVFEVNPAVLIPRIETEQLVAMALQEVSSLLENQQSVSIAEIGTGSGAMSIVMAKHLAKMDHSIEITASDVSADALQIAELNSHQLLDDSCPQIEFLESNLLSSFSRKKFNLVVANLPYIPSSYVDHLDDSVIKHEPRIALDGGSDGLNLISQLLDQIPKYLAKNGIILLEINHTHRLDDFKKWQSLFDIEIMPDENGANRYLRAKLK